MGGADENLIRARSGELRVTQLCRGNVGNEEPVAGSAGKAGAAPSPSSRAGREEFSA